jgi:hypothetical protein
LAEFFPNRGISEEGLRDISKVMNDWSRNILGDFQKRIKRLKKELAQCLKGPVTQANIQNEQVLRYKLEKLEEQKNICWKQRAHIHWLREGDRNTCFFHACASQRKKRNRTKRLKTEDGIWVEGDDLCGYVHAQYHALFQSQGINRLGELINKVELRVSPAMNDLLTADFTEEEINIALNSIGDLKAPGSDGMPAIFSRNFGT